MTTSKSFTQSAISTVLVHLAQTILSTSTENGESSVSCASSARFSLFVRFVVGGLSFLCGPFQTVQQCRYVIGRLGYSFIAGVREISTLLQPPAPLLLLALLHCYASSLTLCSSLTYSPHSPSLHRLLTDLDWSLTALLLRYLLPSSFSLFSSLLLPLRPSHNTLLPSSSLLFPSSLFFLSLLFPPLIPALYSLSVWAHY